MRFIRPTKITDAMVASSTVPEDDHPTWSAGTSYTLGQRVIRTQTHRIYERIIAGTTATAPENDLVNWLDVGPTNLWALFDEVVGTATTAADSMTYVIEAGRVDSLAILNADAASVQIDLVVAGANVYSASLDLINNNNVGDWYQYFYEPFYRNNPVVVTDLLDAALINVPPFGEGTLTVTLARPGGTVSCGMLVVGLLTTLGETIKGADVSIRDFSRKERDQFGHVVLIERDWVREMSAQVLVTGGTERVDYVFQEVARYRATPVVIIGTERYGASVFFGFFNDGRVTLEHQGHSIVQIKCEGMI